MGQPKHAAPRKRGIGIPFFFSWANEAWESKLNKRSAFKGDPTSRVNTTGVAMSTPRPSLIPQGYGSRADWESHFEWLLPFFRHEDYVRVGGAPLLVIYDASDFEQARPGDTLPEAPLGWCNVTSRASDSCGGRRTPHGCAAAELYLRWYPHLQHFLTIETAFAYHVIQGESLGCAWPRSDPCLPSQVPKGRHLLPAMLATWQRLARASGLSNGLHFLFTFNHQPGSMPTRQLATPPAQVGHDGAFHGMVQFWPMSLVTMPFMTHGWPWGASGNFYWGLQRLAYREEAGLPETTELNTLHEPRGFKMTCETLLRQVGADEVDRLYVRALRHAQAPDSPELSIVRGAFATWSNYPRGKNRGAAYCRDPSPAAYQRLLEMQLRRALADAGGPKACAATSANVSAAAGAAWRHLVLVNAWNEWGEQASIEPSVQDGFAMLNATAAAIINVTSSMRRHHLHAHARVTP